jgi:ABC-type spermidine/putrescine transport system permease subunit II
MTSPILRILGAVAGLGSAILCWFLGTRLAVPLRRATVPLQSGPQYALLAFLLVPALILAVVALFWVPPRVSGEGPLPEGRIWRLALVLTFLAAFVSGLLR